MKKRSKKDQIIYLIKTSRVLTKKNITIFFSIFSFLLLTVTLYTLFYHEHSYGNSEIIKFPTCAEKGMERRFCSCGSIEEKMINKIDHIEGSWFVDEQTNTRKLPCSQCGEILKIESLADHTHTWGDWITIKETTCESSGEKERNCSCGAVDTLTFAPSGHNFSNWEITTHPTCNANGVEKRQCLCGKEETQNIPSLKHTKDTFIIANNEKQYPCINCGAIIESEALKISEGLDIENGIVKGIGTCTDSEIVIPSSFDGVTVTKIDYKAFSYSSITSIILPDSVAIIEEKAFYDCSSLEYIHFGNNLDTIGKQAFTKCDNIKEITLPTSLQNIEDRAFSYCTNLNKILFLGTELQWNAINKDIHWLDGVINYKIEFK